MKDLHPVVLRIVDDFFVALDETGGALLHPAGQIDRPIGGHRLHRVESVERHRLRIEAQESQDRRRQIDGIDGDGDPRSGIDQAGGPQAHDDSQDLVIRDSLVAHQAAMLGERLAVVADDAEDRIILEIHLGKLRVESGQETIRVPNGLQVTVDRLSCFLLKP